MIQKQTDYYKGLASRLNEHSKGMRAVTMLPKVEKQIEVQRTLRKAYERYRVLKEYREFTHLLTDYLENKREYYLRVKSCYLAK